VRCGFQNLVRKLEKNGYIAIHLIHSEEKTIAAIGTFTFHKKILYFQAGFDPDYYRFSPGTVLFAQCISDAIADKADEFDFLFGDEEFKFAWSTVHRLISQIDIKTGSLPGFIYTLFLAFQSRLLQSDRFRALYFKFFYKN